MFFDYNTFSDPEMPGFAMMPPLNHFTENMKALDIRKSDNIVVYDQNGSLSAPRAYWIFKNFGLPNVCILNGSFFKWEQEHRLVESGDKPNAWKRIRTTLPKPDDFNFELNNS